MQTNDSTMTDNFQFAFKQAVALIHDGVAGCVVIRNGSIAKTAAGDGIGPVIELYEAQSFKDAFVVDKIVGKAAAMLFVLGGARGVYGLTMSESGKEFLLRHGVTAECEQFVPFIINRAGKDMCPMERTVQFMEDPEAALCALSTMLERLRGIHELTIND